MTARPSTSTRSTGSIATALVLALGPLLWLCYAVQRASYAELGRDQGIFQGTAWAIAHGAVLYRDLREINGPLVHEIHLLARLFGGSDAHVLRSFDLAVSALVFAFFGAALPGATRAQPARQSGLERLAWAAAACVVLLSQYVAFYDYWQLTQRESFFNWFVLAGFACALRARTSATARRARAWLLLAGVVSATPWFGKPQCLLYTLVHVATFAWGAFSVRLAPRQRMLAFALGLVLGCALQVAFLVSCGGIPEFLRIYLVENPRYYFHIWPRFLEDIVTLEDHIEFFPLAIVLLLCTSSLVAMRQLGRNMLGMAAFPLLGMAFDILQRKGFLYHLHPVTAGTAALAVALTCHMASMAGDPEREPQRTWWPLLIAALIAYHSARALIAGPYLHARRARNEPWPDKTPAASLLANYNTRSFSAVGLAQAGAFLRRHTNPSDRIQMYGMDPYLLALAERHSATPYIYAIDLNPDAVLEGLRTEGSSQDAREAARALARTHVADFVTRVRRANPAAFVFFDRAPFQHPANGFDDFAAHIPELLPLLRARYREVAVFGLLHVYLRNDRSPGPDRTGSGRMTAPSAGSH